MREYKFRCWDTENKEMLKVQELDFEDTFYGGINKDFGQML